MTTTIGEATIKVTADSSGARTDLEKTKASVRNLESSIKRLETQAANTGKSFKEIQLSKLEDRGATADQLKRAAAALDVTEAFKAQKRAAEQAANAMATGGATAAAQMALLGKNTRQAAFQQQQLAFQLNDFFVQVASGGSPLTAFIQQGSQLSGTFGGAGNAFRALTGLLTPLRLVIGGTAAAVGAFAFAAYEGAQQSQDFARAIQLTGNFAGITEGRFNSLVRSVSKATGETAGGVREIAQALLASGQIGPQVFAQATAAATGYARATGKTAEEVAKDFAKMAESPSKFAAEANKQFNFITAAQYAAIKAFEDTGRAADAQGLVFDALARKFPNVTQNLGYLERALLLGKTAWSTFWDSAFDIGRTKTIEQKIAETQQAIDRLQPRAVAENAGGAGFVGQTSGRRRSTQATALAELQASQTATLRQAFREQENAFAAADNAAVQKAGIAAVEFKAKSLEAAKGVSALNKELAENARQFKAAAAAGVPFSEAEKKIIDAATRKKFATTAGRTDDAERRAQLDADLREAQSIAQQQVAGFQRAGALLDAARAAQLVSEADYYAARRKLIEGQAQVEDNELVDQIARLEIEQASGAERVRLLERAAELETRRTVLAADAASRITILNIQEEDSRKRVVESIQAQNRALEEYIDGLRRAAGIEAQSVGLGDRGRSDLRARADIEDRARRREEDLRRQQRSGSITDEQFNTQLAALREFKAQELAAYVQGNASILREQGDWANGMTRAFENYRDEAANTARLTEDLFSKAFRGLEDALVTFVTTGKLSFKSLADSIVADITRIIIKQSLIKPLESLLSGSGGGFGDFIGSILGGPRAMGGPVSANRAYQVNETGRPELFSAGGRDYLLTHNSSGTVKPVEPSQGRGGAVSVTINQTFAAGSDRSTVEHAAARAARTLSEAVRRRTA